MTIGMRDKRNLVLVGNSGAGKNTLANGLAEVSGRIVRDIDAEIEALAGVTIPEIFGPDRKGEPRFRGLETKCLGSAIEGENLIIVPGAGAIMNEENRTLMRTGFCLWINPVLRIILKRLKGNKDRPNAQSEEDITKRYWDRLPWCADVADAIVGFDVDLPPEEVTERSLHKLGWK